MSANSDWLLTFVAAASVAGIVLAAPASAVALEILPTFADVPPEYAAIVESAITAWEAHILDPFAVSMEFAVTALPGDILARTSNFVAASSGWPSSAHIQIDNRDGDIGWFLDPTPHEWSEFTGTGGHLLADRAGPASGRFDLLTVVQHEMAHALGFSVQYPLFAAHVVSNADGARVYQGAALEVPLSSVGTHVASSAFPYDAMTDLLGIGERRPISALDVLMLSDAFGYRVRVPQAPAVREPGTAQLVYLGILLATAARTRYRSRRLAINRRWVAVRRMTNSRTISNTTL